MSAVLTPPPVIPPPPQQGCPKQDWAGRYAAKGLPPIAIGSNAKRPLHTGWQFATLADTLAHLNAEPAYNLGIAVPPGYFVLDMDVKTNADGRATLQAFELTEGTLPDTLRATTPSGGMHYWFSVPSGTDVP